MDMRGHGVTAGPIGVGRLRVHGHLRWLTLAVSSAFLLSKMLIAAVKSARQSFEIVVSRPARG